MSNLKHWKIRIAFGILLLGLPLLAIYFNGSNALSGIIYGVSNEAKYLDTIDIHKLNVNYGVYDPEHKFSKSNGLAFDHYYYQWNKFNKARFMEDMIYSEQKNRWPIITIEPYPFTWTTKNQLFFDIQKGKYDTVIYQIYDAIKSYGKPIFLRWGHEMEKVTGRYAWASKDYVGYTSSYRYVVNKFKPLGKSVYFVWSPIGNQELFNYWPGTDYVDFIGISIYSFSDWEKKYYGDRRSFQTLFQEKYDRIKLLGKPIIIAELGINGDRKTQNEWLKKGFKSFSKFPELKSVIYFNAKDSKDAWGNNFSTPEWQIDSTIFNRKKLPKIK